MKQEIELAIQRYQSKLTEESSNLLKGLDDVEFFLKSFFDPDSHQPYYNYATHAFNREGINHHDFQRYIFEKVKEFYSEFDRDVEIDLQWKGSYPSPIIVKFEGYPIISFSYVSHYYSDNRPVNSLEHLEQDIKIGNKRIAELKDKITQYREYDENLLRVLSPRNYNSKGFKVYRIIARDIFILIKIGRKKIRENIHKRIEDWHIEIERLEKNIKKNEERILKLKNTLPELNMKYDAWEKKMIEIGYDKK